MDSADKYPNTGLPTLYCSPYVGPCGDPIPSTAAAALPELKACADLTTCLDWAVNSQPSTESGLWLRGRFDTGGCATTLACSTGSQWD